MISTDLEIDAYLASKRASHHKLRTLATKGARGYYIAHEQRGHTAEDTKAYLVGRAFEDALQRPGEYKARYVAKPEGMSFATKDGKTWRAEQEAAGLSIVEGEDARAIEALLGTLESCPTAQRLIADATAQVTVYHEDAVRGRWDIPGIQSRPDWLCLEGSAASGWRPYALDLKTTRSLGDLCSGRAIVKYGYHRQAAMVRTCLEYEGVDVADFRYLLLGAEKGFPHRWGVIEVPTQLIDVGQRWCEAQLDRLAEHYATGEWPLVESEVLVADVPAWLDESEAA
jgi:hypothetical protein